MERRLCRGLTGTRLLKTHSPMLDDPLQVSMFSVGRDRNYNCLQFESGQSGGLAQSLLLVVWDSSATFDLQPDSSACMSQILTGSHHWRPLSGVSCISQTESERERERERDSRSENEIALKAD